ncbi:hypothetical protein C086_00867 [Brucella abortus F6/05-3]|nr:putative peptidase M23B [Brucella abortus]AIJ76868.1 putative peptidase M23B [Brucella abortus]EEX82384.1 predicted protein [Brucella abortus bv. 3 str. Tulya]ENS15782.1 hypothetical protein B995_00614 [Brucella abortus F1/06-B21]ENS27881.1 hypothetical protein C086_00867 [Brucella abortus F6/05-3]
MAEKQAEMKRKKPPAVIIARGRKISHFALRPWMVAAGGTALLVLCIVHPSTAEVAPTTNRLAPLVERAFRLQPMPDMPLKPIAAHARHAFEACTGATQPSHPR